MIFNVLFYLNLLKFVLDKNDVIACVFAGILFLRIKLRASYMLGKQFNTESCNKHKHGMVLSICHVSVSLCFGHLKFSFPNISECMFYYFLPLLPLSLTSSICLHYIVPSAIETKPNCLHFLDYCSKWLH